MSRELKFFKCKKTGTIVERIIENCDALVCCGEDMKLLKANSSDGAGEKHVPAVTVDGNVVTVNVGSVAHPMTDEHHIAFVVLVTEKTVQRVDLPHTGEPVAVFTLGSDDKALAAYEYCNLHGLWVAEI